MKEEVTKLYLQRISFRQALMEQETAYRMVQDGEKTLVLLGFEADPIITLGRRAKSEDIVAPPPAAFEVIDVERGGQATLHNPGQLVIFPIFNVRPWGARRWVEALAQITQTWLAHFEIATKWNLEHPGLYTARGKIMACGVRIRHGISTHGIAINVKNDLTDFALIRSCGVSQAAVDRMGPDFDLQTIFELWAEQFKTHFAL